MPLERQSWVPDQKPIPPGTHTRRNAFLPFIPIYPNARCNGRRNGGIKGRADDNFWVARNSLGMVTATTQDRVSQRPSFLCSLQTPPESGKKVTRARYLFPGIAASVARDYPLDFGFGYQPSSDNDGGDLLYIANIDQRIGIKQYQIGTLAHLNGSL